MYCAVQYTGYVYKCVCALPSLCVTVSVDYVQSSVLVDASKGSEYSDVHDPLFFVCSR